MENGVATVTGWVEELSLYGLRVGGSWVSWAVGGTPRPYLGDYAEVQVDAEGYALDVVVRAWRPLPPNQN